MSCSCIVDVLVKLNENNMSECEVFEYSRAKNQSYVVI